LISPSHSKTSWISIDTPAYTIPIGGAAVLLALAVGIAFEVVLEGLVSAGATTAILLWVAAREPAPVTPNAF